ncbi:MFS transporter [Streptomyces sp. Qhu-G9]|uniref:MFS transporter n=1 Tax=Streptomyces sp. Qhu-G9 TaxID=3452799 RepID=UPI0022ABFFFE|nr:MFS transporter [Streptomyces aurantiacus]WAU84816.1 MFS transporter [Streptomyces aurantiacus]
MSASSTRPSYAAVLRMPHATRTFTAALAGRLSYGMVSLAVLLAVSRATGSFAAAGAVVALFGAANVFLSPLRAALVDRYGPRRALLPMASLYAGLLCVLAEVSRHPGVPVPVIAAVAVAAGACAPPLGAAMRAVWSELVTDRRLLQRAYSLDGVAEELLFVSGPLLVGLVVGFASPAVAVVVSALLVGLGTLAFVASPAVRGVTVRAVRTGRRTRPGRGLVQPVVVAAGVGLSLGAVDLLVLAFAEQRGHGDGTVAWIFAALSAGSAVGGLLYGAVEWRAGARRRLPVLTAGLGLALAVAGLAPGLVALTGAVVCAGFFVAPALTTAYLVADESAAPGARVRAGAWVNTAVNAGVSAGAAAGGLLVDRVPPEAGFALAGGAALLAAAAVGIGAVRPRALPQEQEQEQEQEQGQGQKGEQGREQEAGPVEQAPERR